MNPRDRTDKHVLKFDGVEGLQDYIDHIEGTYASFGELGTLVSVAEWHHSYFFNLGIAMLQFMDGDCGMYVDLIPVNTFILPSKTIRQMIR